MVSTSGNVSFLLLALSLSKGADGTLKVNEHPYSSHTYTLTSNYLRQNGKWQMSTSNCLGSIRRSWHGKMHFSICKHLEQADIWAGA